MYEGKEEKGGGSFRKMVCRKAKKRRVGEVLGRWCVGRLRREG